MRLIAPLALAALCVLHAAGTAAADIRTIDRPPFEVIYDGERHERVARKVAEVCEDEVERLAAELGLERVSPVRVEVVDDMRPYRRAYHGDLPEWGVAFALLREQLMVVDVQRATRAYNSLENVISHELSHLLLAQRVGVVRCPVWFLEGLAQWQAREWSLVDSWQLMNAVWSKGTPRLWHLMERYPVGETRARTAYRLSYAAFTDLFGSRAEELPSFLGDLGTSQSFEAAFGRFTGVGLETWMVDFHERLERKYHSRLLVFQTGPLFSIAAVVFLFIGLRMYVRKRRRLRDLAGDEAGGPLGD